MEAELTTHLSDWDDEDVVQAGEAISVLIESEGWDAFLRVVDSHERAIHKNLLTRVSESAAEYATLVGHMKGLREVEVLANGVVKKAKRIEQTRREREVAA